MARVQPDTDVLLRVEDLSLSYSTDAGRRTVFSGLRLSLREGEILGLVGPSGCGKTSLALALLGLLPPNATLSGSVVLLGRRLDALNEKEWSALRGAAVSLVFQDPRAALDPLLILSEQFKAVATRGDSAIVPEMEDFRRRLRQVGFAEPDRILHAYPHELSGGECQRAYLALALYPLPKLLICDEITAALDAPLRVEILYLLKGLAREHGVAILFISHQRAEVQFVADRWCNLAAVTDETDRILRRR